MPFFEKKPEKVLESMFSKVASDLKTYHIKSNAKINLTVASEKNTIPVSIGNQAGLEIAMEGDVDLNNEDSPKSASKADLNVEAGIFKFNLGLEAVTLGKQYFYKIKNLPIPGLNEMIGKDFQVGEWYSLDLEEIQKLAGSADNKITPLTIDEQKKEAEVIKNKIKEAITRYHLLIPEERLQDEKLSGKKMYHYRVKLNKEDLKSLFIEIFNTIKSDLEKEKLVTSADANKTNESIDKAMSYIEDAHGEIWVDKKDFNMNKIIFDIKLGTPEKDFSAQINLNSELSNINQYIEIKGPASAKSITEILQKSLEENKEKSKIAKKISDVKMIQTALELYFNDFNEYPETLEKLSKNDKKTVYMSRLPIDPDTNKNYQYKPISKPISSYQMEFNLEGEGGGLKAGLNIATPSGIQEAASEAIQHSQDSDWKKIQLALELFFNDHNAYPANLKELEGKYLKDSALDLAKLKYYSIGKAKQNYIIKKPAAKANEWDIITPRGVFLGDKNKDSDNDGLFDAEEEQWGTDPTKDDTDRDGYKDGTEVEKGYNPNGPGKL